jgi:hypothetical protein
MIFHDTGVKGRTGRAGKKRPLHPVAQAGHAIVFLLLGFALWVMAGCEDAESDGVRIKFQLKTYDTPNQQERISTRYIYTSDIDYYDFSSHRIYLKKENTFLQGVSGGSFTVYVGKEEIYTGSIYSLLSSFIPSGPVIQSISVLSNAKVIGIDIMLIEDPPYADPRGDWRIANALQKHGQYCEGCGEKSDE